MDLKENRAGEVFQALLAYIGEGAIQSTLDLVVHYARDADPTRLGNTLQPRGNVDAVAVYVALFDDHITRIDTAAKLDALILEDGVVLRRHLPLYRDGAGARFDDTRELD